LLLTGLLFFSEYEDPTARALLAEVTATPVGSP